MSICDDEYTRNDFLENCSLCPSCNSVFGLFDVYCERCDNFVCPSCVNKTMRCGRCSELNDFSMCPNCRQEENDNGEYEIVCALCESMYFCDSCLEEETTRCEICAQSAFQKVLFKRDNQTISLTKEQCAIRSNDSSGSDILFMCNDCKFNCRSELFFDCDCPRYEEPQLLTTTLPRISNSPLLQDVWVLLSSYLDCSSMKNMCLQNKFLRYVQTREMNTRISNDKFDLEIRQECAASLRCQKFFNSISLDDIKRVHYALEEKNIIEAEFFRKYWICALTLRKELPTIEYFQTMLDDWDYLRLKMTERYSILRRALLQRHLDDFSSSHIEFCNLLKNPFSIALASRVRLREYVPPSVLRDVTYRSETVSREDIMKEVGMWYFERLRIKLKTLEALELPLEDLWMQKINSVVNVFKWTPPGNERDYSPSLKRVHSELLWERGGNKARQLMLILKSAEAQVPLDVPDLNHQIYHFIRSELESFDPAEESEQNSS